MVTPRLGASRWLTRASAAAPSRLRSPRMTICGGPGRHVIGVPIADCQANRVSRTQETLPSIWPIVPDTCTPSRFTLVWNEGTV